MKCTLILQISKHEWEGALKSGKHKKSLRKNKGVDYRLMHSWKDAENESSSADTASEIEKSRLRALQMGESTSTAHPESPIVPPLWLQEDEKEYDDEMAEMSAEMSRLDDEEKKLATGEKLQTMRQEVAAK